MLTSEQMEDRISRLLNIGYKMSNTLYNLSQGDSLTERERNIMAGLVKDWDGELTRQTEPETFTGGGLPDPDRR